MQPEKHWTTACPDWQKRIMAGENLIPFSPLFPQSANEALAIFARLKLMDVVGEPHIGEVTRDWVYQFVAAIFGAYDPVGKRRLIRDFFLLISKKNTKSTIAAAIMVTALRLNQRHSAEFIILAPTIEVAGNSFVPARDMIKNDPELSAIFHIQEHTRTITDITNGSTLKVVAADSGTVGGKKATGILIDELHLFGEKNGATAMIAEATGGLLSRPEGFVIKLSTQSTKAPAGVFRDELSLARAVRDGKVSNPRYLPVLYEFPPEMVANESFRQPEHFYMTNPNLGLSVDTETLNDMLRKAEFKGKEELNEFFAKHLNVEIGLNLAADGWAGAEFWQQGIATQYRSLDTLIAQSEIITVGIDGGGMDDLLGLCVLGRNRENPMEWLCWTHAWAHPIVFERRKEIAPRLQDFAKQGDLTICQRVGDDTAEIATICAQIYATGRLDKIGLDPSGIGAILDALAQVDIPEEQIIGVSQGWRLGGAIKTTERKLAEGCLKHSGSAMMAWCVGNAKIEPRANSILITKQASGSAKIDPLMALFDAVSLMALNPQPQYYAPEIFTL